MLTDAYGGVPALKGTPTGAFHIERINGRHSLVTPDGHGFFSLGVVHIGAIAEKHPNDIFTERYGRDWGKVSEKAAADLRDWGFNTVGYHAPMPIRDLFPFLADSYSTRNSNFLPREAFHYQDVFDPVFQETVREAVRRMIRSAKDNPRLIGYYWTDTPQWDLRRARQTRRTDWVSAIRALPAEAPGKRRYIEFLHGRHGGDLAAMEAAYNAGAASWDALHPDPFDSVDHENPTVRDDDREFLRLIARELYGVIGRETREGDPGRLVFGERYLQGDHPDEVIGEALPWIDALAIQPLGAAFDAALYDRLHEMTGKPILLCDHQSSFATPQYPKTMWPQVGSEEAAGRAYVAFLEAAVARPYILGYHRCQYIDRVVPYMGVLKQGLLREDETPYGTMIEYTKKGNRGAMARFSEQRKRESRVED